MRKASPVEVMAAAGPKDDPMDLGPFLKEYVLNNPFNSTPSPPPPRPLPIVAIKSRPLRGPSPTVALLPRNNCSPVLPVQSVNHVPVLAVKALPIVAAPPMVQQVAPLIHASPVNLSRRDERPKSEKEEEEEPQEPVQFGGVVDTPKAHIGSNKNFAAMLREMKLPHKHTKVKKWLLTYYRHVGNSPEWLSSDDLIDHANTLFSDLKSSVLSRIMKVTFPNCHKVINKYGYFYIGLVRRPEAQHYSDELLRMAAKVVVEGRLTSENAAKIQGVPSQLVNRMVAWYDTINDPIPEERRVMSDTGSDETEEEAAVPAPRTNLKWKLRQRARSRLLSKIKQSSENDEKDDQDGAWEPYPRPSPYNTRSPRRRRGGKTTRPASENGDNEPLTVKCEQDSDKEDDDRMDEDLPGSGASDVTASSGSPLPVISAIGSLEVKVKDEPVDTGYDQFENNNNCTSDGANSCVGSKHDDSPVKESFNTLRTLLTEKPVIPLSKGAKSPEGVSSSSCTKSSLQSTDGSTGSAIVIGSAPSGRPQSLNSVVDLLTMKQELQRTKEELKVKVEENDILGKRLKEAHGEITNLKKTVATQDTKLMDLAAEFFDLSNRFMKVTHKFKQALSESNLSIERS